MPSIWTPPRVLYSAVSSLAYLIGQRFYAKTHYVWCAPVNPPSSDPTQIYWAYHHAIATGDQHSGVIRRNRAGIADGAATRRSQQVIDSTAERTITELARSAQLVEFRPLLLGIPFHAVATQVRPAAIKARARVTSEAYIIENLPRNCFDIVELHRRPMDLETIATPLDRQITDAPERVAIRAVYLAMRCPRHRLTRDMLPVQPDIHLYDSPAIALAVNLIDTIEALEGASIPDLSDAVLDDYQGKLWDPVSRRLAAHEITPEQAAFTRAFLADVRALTRPFTAA